VRLTQPNGGESDEPSRNIVCGSMCEPFNAARALSASAWVAITTKAKDRKSDWGRNAIATVTAVPYGARRAFI